MRIFLGSDDIASILSGLAEGFKDLGHDVTTFVFGKNKFYPHIQYDLIAPSFLDLPFPDKNGNGITKVINKLSQRVNHILITSHLKGKSSQWIEQFDLFLFVWRPWLDEAQLLPKIKAAGKKIICVHVGSDVRDINVYRQEYNVDVSLWEQCFHEEDINQKLKKIRFHELYADTIYSAPDQSGLAIRPYNHLYLPISKTKNIKYHVPTRKEPLIIHAPTRNGAKGTALIVETLNKLRQEGHQFSFEVIQNLPNYELISRLTNADILVDELFAHGPGVLGIEAMLAGCIVATRTLPEHKKIFDPPVVNITPENIYTQLKFLINNASHRIELAEKARQFASTHNNPSGIAQAMLHDLENNDRQYTPSFYLERLNLPEGTGLTKENKIMSLKVAKEYFTGDHSHLERASRAGLI